MPNSRSPAHDALVPTLVFPPSDAPEASLAVPDTAHLQRRSTPWEQSALTRLSSSCRQCHERLLGNVTRTHIKVVPWELGVSWESDAGSRLSISLETETRLLHSLGNQTPAHIEAAPGKWRRGYCTCDKKRFCTGCGQGKQTIKHMTLMYIKAFY
ncbi:hypothetical protein NDU88_006799 [Pleurodeles waltl]|uniref:Uncharacterized protein n=1 Tax=Pleurodeles waltl TaxID=8319 RepID=A0AAV7TXV5_PLEWA|nr:hypothetical protein NDU88_006799 [Pleurodeles waltl]